MGSLITTFRNNFILQPPWRHLHSYTSITILGLQRASKTTLMYQIAALEPAKPPVVTVTPSMALFLEIMQRERVNIIAMVINFGRKPDTKPEEVVINMNRDAITFIVDCQDERWIAAKEQLKKVVFTNVGIPKTPLLVFANKWHMKVTFTTLIRRSLYEDVNLLWIMTVTDHVRLPSTLGQSIVTSMH